MNYEYLGIGQREEILNAAEKVEEEIWKNHIGLFIRNFIVAEKRQRWLNLCLEKPNVRDKSHKMHNDLIRSLCVEISDDARALLMEQIGRGVYYEFSGEARWLSPRQALLVGYGKESIFSLKEGELCFYFWHEMKDYLFEKPKKNNSPL